MEAIVTPFISAAVLTFKTMLQIDINPGAPSEKKGHAHGTDISGTIGLSGLAQGFVTLGFPKTVALHIVQAMLGMEMTEIDSDVVDAIGEITNIVAGNAKLELTVFNLSISLPTVVVGSDHRVEGMSGIEVFVVPFSSALGDFMMEVSLKPL